MPLPSTREELKDYCLRKLGAPVLDINVDNYQLEDRIDEAIQFFQNYHFDGVERLYLKHKVTATVLPSDVAITGTFTRGEMITGSLGASGKVYDQADDDLSIRMVHSLTSPQYFQPGEVVVGESSGATLTISNTTAITVGDMDNRWIPTTSNIVSIQHVHPLPTATYSSSFFNIRYQFALNEMYNLVTTDLTTYTMFRQHLALWDELFVGDKIFRHNQKQDKIYLDITWSEDVEPDDFLIIEVLATLDPEQYPEIWSDEFLMDYVTELFKQQWGTNLRKFRDMQLPGGLTLNGEEIYNEATENLKELRERVRTEFEQPSMFIVG